MHLPRLDVSVRGRHRDRAKPMLNLYREFDRDTHNLLPAIGAEDPLLEGWAAALERHTDQF